MQTWAAGWLPDVSSLTLPVRVLLALATTGLCGLLSGLLVQILSRTVTQTKAPKPAVNMVRIAGAVAGAMLALLWLFGTGGGFGFGGGGGDGKDKGGGGKDDTTYADVRSEPKKNGEEPKKTGPDTPAGEDVLRIEVLGNMSIGKEAAEQDRRFRLPSVSASKLLTLGEVKNYISQRSREGHTPDRLHLIFYKHDTRPRDKDLALYGTDKDGLEAMAHDLGKDKVAGGWIKSDILDQAPPM